MLGKIAKKLTNNHKEVPLFYTTFNLNKYHKDGPKNSCLTSIHPELKNDEFVTEKLGEIIDHIRDNYDMDKLVK